MFYLQPAPSESLPNKAGGNRRGVIKKLSLDRLMDTVDWNSVSGLDDGGVNSCWRCVRSVYRSSSGCDISLGFTMIYCKLNIIKKN